MKVSKSVKNIYEVMAAIVLAVIIYISYCSFFASSALILVNEQFRDYAIVIILLAMFAYYFYKVERGDF